MEWDVLMPLPQINWTKHIYIVWIKSILFSLFVWSSFEMVWSVVYIRERLLFISDWSCLSVILRGWTLASLLSDPVKAFLPLHYNLKWASFWENRSSGLPTRSHTDRAVQSQKMARSLNFIFRKQGNCTSYEAKTKAPISFAVTAKLICVFVFAYAKSRPSRDEAQIFGLKACSGKTYIYDFTFFCV